MNFSLWPNRKRTTPHHRHRPITIRIPPRPTQPIHQIPLRTLILLPKHPILIKTILITSINNKIFKITILTTISRIEKSHSRNHRFRLIIRLDINEYNKKTSQCIYGRICRNTIGNYQNIDISECRDENKIITKVKS